MLANDNNVDPSPVRVSFHPFAAWCAITIDGEPVGYMSHKQGVGTELHLKKNAPAWMRDVRVRGVFSGHWECQEAIKAAAPGLL